MIFFYHLFVLLFGYIIYKQFVNEKKIGIHTLIYSVTFGLLSSIPLTYFISIVFPSSDNRIYLSILLFIFGVLIISFIERKKLFLNKHTGFNIHNYKTFVEGVVICFSLLFSWYIMSKTLKFNSDGLLLVARNVVFDLGHSLSIIRSMSWGNNIPYSSPFVSDTQHIYHFMFYFWSSLYESMGISINWALNIPSTISFSLLLLMVYFLGKDRFNSILIGVLAVLFTVFHSSFIFIPFFQQYGLSLKEIWFNPNYLFNGITDNSIYSIFFTLNVFLNQRHLGISIVVFFLIYILFADFVKEKITIKQLLILSVLCSLFILWHIILSIVLIGAIIVHLLFHKKIKESVIYIICLSSLSLIILSPWISTIIRIITSLFQTTSLMIYESSVNQFNLVSFFSFITLNLGLLLVFFIFGLITNKKNVMFFLPVFIVILLATIVSVKVGLSYQKYLNVFLILFSLFGAAGIYECFNKRYLIKVITILLFPFIIISGVVDFMVIKNDYLFPVSNTKPNELVSWINKNIPRNVTILGYQEIFDPVTLSGRKNYYGFFKQPEIFLSKSDKYRDKKVRDIFLSKNKDELVNAVNSAEVDYILLSLINREDVPYAIDVNFMRSVYPVVLEDYDHLILDTKM